MNIFSNKNLGQKATDAETKQHLLKMLLELDAFCKKHHLRYYLSGGTLLGAIRHQGFIPWDDDIDVNMPRSDCDKLMELSGGKIGSYILNPPNCTDEYHAYHWKLYDESILVQKSGKGRPYPIFIDIFPIEGLPHTQEETKKHYRNVTIWKYVANCLWSKKWFQGSSAKAKVFHAALRPFAMLFGRETLFRKVTQGMKQYPFESSEYVGVMSTLIHTTEERVIKDDYLPVADVSFEGHRFPAPANYDTYLRQLYGDYMKLPPVEQQTSRHRLIPYHCIPETTPRIAVCGLIQSDNLGELFIARSLETLIRNEYSARCPDQEITFIEVDLFARKDNIQQLPNPLKDHRTNYYAYKDLGIPADLVFHGLKKLERKCSSRALCNASYKLRHFIFTHCMNFKKRLQCYFDSRLQGCDFLVIDGAGLLEYSFNEYQEYLNFISEYAEKHNLKVVYNAIGRAGEYDESDFRCKILTQALRSDAVCYVSARDSAENVQHCVGSKLNVKLLADAAFWLHDTYPLPAPDNRAKVGIGIVRGNALQGYGTSFTPEDWITLFSGIAYELKSRGYAFEFFTNGLPKDIDLGRQILAEMNLPDEYLVPKPVTDLELYQTINHYQGIITCRMHSSIAAFTLGVPSVILSWNEKVEKLMHIIGYPERAVTLDHFQPGYIVDLFEQCLESGVSESNVAKMKQLAQESVTDYIDLMISEIQTHHS